MSLVVVRGSYRGTDPTYACTAHDTQQGRYLLLEVEGGKVSKRTVVPASDRRGVENAMQSYRGSVYVDKRTDAGLLPLTAPAHAREADLASMRRAKSDEELDALRGLSRDTIHLLNAPKVSASTFRGAAARTGNKSGFEVTRKHGFTQYRGGIMDGKGRVSDLTRVDAHTPEWEARLARVDRGLQAVYRAITPGAKVADLDRIFVENLDSEKDVVYGSVVHHTGFESHEDSLPLHTVDKYDFLTVGAAVGDGKETALIYRNAVAVGDEQTYGATAADDATDTTAAMQSEDLAKIAAQREADLNAYKDTVDKKKKLLEDARDAIVEKLKEARNVSDQSKLAMEQEIQDLENQLAMSDAAKTHVDSSFHAAVTDLVRLSAAL